MTAFAPGVMLSIISQEEYPRWKVLANIGRLPVIKRLLSSGYKLIATNRHFLFGQASRIFWLKIVIVGGLISGLLLSTKLWTSERLFPRAPILNNFPTPPPHLETILFLFLMWCLAATLISPRPQKFIFFVLSLGAIFVFFDQMRLQPWFYQYLFMLAVLGLFSWNHFDTEKRQAALNTLRLIVASIYFFSGLQKINPVFITGVFPWLIEPIAKLFPAPFRISLLSAGVIIPFLEMGIGIGLLFPKSRNYAVYFALLMHSFILFTLGPLGHNWNSVVWPWNIAMSLFVVILFWKTENFSFKDVLGVKNFPFQRIVLLLFAIMPIFSFFNFWDSYPSFALYAGNTSKAQIYISASVKERLPQKLQRYALLNGVKAYRLDFSNWSFDELNVPPYPETRIYKAIARNICRYAQNPFDVVLIIHAKQNAINPGAKSTHYCSEL
jgi:hypothetical protein